ncbi:L-arabinose transport system permease protein AraQ [Adhaeretor mobilis]|uniref:L-arabinose transport system permease protein AraQ n=2 Tax=Adhaeretor mobilis TaxID=1930276 RepID=A0A517MSG6_9BACT|nr:L-arabinose transport system permease protein AraQ [Adhaeretor mobilis]
MKSNAMNDNHETSSNIAGKVLVVLATALFAIPLVWMVLTSLKTPEQIANAPYSWWPSPLRWENYREAVSAMPFLRYLVNTLVLCLGSVAGTLFSCTLAAYAFARLRFPGRNLLFAVLIATMLLPWQVTMAPRFLLIRELGLYDSLGALIAPTFLGNAFYIFLLRQFFLTIPQDMIEAARMDGASELGILWRIALPLARPALATVALLQFVAAWNNYGGPLLYLNDPQHFPLAYGLERFVSSHSTQTHLLMAAAVLFTLPIVAAFFLAQRLFLRGIATTGLKG